MSQYSYICKHMSDRGETSRIRREALQHRKGKYIGQLFHNNVLFSSAPLSTPFRRVFINKNSIKLCAEIVLLTRAPRNFLIVFVSESNWDFKVAPLNTFHYTHLWVAAPSNWPFNTHIYWRFMPWGMKSWIGVNLGIKSGRSYCCWGEFGAESAKKTSNQQCNYTCLHWTRLYSSKLT